MVKREQTEKEFLANYDVSFYERPSVAVDMLIFTILNRSDGDIRKLSEKKLKLLLIKRRDHPFKECWALPGGFVNIDEAIDDAVKRELKEETNVKNIYFEQLYTFGEVDRDPRTRVISCSYMALISHDRLNIQAGDDVSDMAWFQIEVGNRSLKEEGKYQYDIRLVSKEKSLGKMELIS